MTELLIFDSLTKAEIPFRIYGKTIRWYTCGPTVYDHSHIGHARNYVGFDIVRRILEEHFGYIVFQVLNITDVDDKIINRAQEEGIDFSVLAKKWEVAFLEDMQTLGVKPPTSLTRVSEFIPEIIDFIKKLIQKRVAYISNGSVYFDVEEYSKKHTYGRFVDASSSDESEEKSNDKRSKRDFALWKATTEPNWNSPWSRGRPGWHIECSVMATATLGNSLEIHSGGVDLKFPHHENEIAQCDAYHDTTTWVQYFLHSGHLHIDGAKMSKSLKNFITIKDILKKYTPRQLRMLFILHPISSPLEYSSDSMEYAISIDRIMKSFLEKLKMQIKNLSESKWTDEDHVLNKMFIQLQLDVDHGFKQNFNTSRAILDMNKFASDVHRYLEGTPKVYLIHTILSYYQKILTMLGLEYSREKAIDLSTEVTNILVKYRSEIREATKAKDLNKIFYLSDQVRDQDLASLGIKLVDQGIQSHWTN